jgi:soluble lytic murein transglycosylase-like protein
MFSLRPFGRIGLPLTLVVVLLTLRAWGQASNSVEQQFAADHERLSAAAADLLAAPAQIAGKESHEDIARFAIPRTKRENFGMALRRVQQLRPMLEPILREQGVPTDDAAAIVLVESGGRPTALSPKGALGLWQLMPETARRYGLSVLSGNDERLDPVKATRAATRYLRDLYSQFGDWRLAFAAYNSGEQVVLKAMLRSGSREFHRISAFLPTETQAYVPAVMAARPLFGDSHDFTLTTVRAARTAQVLYATARLEN